MIGGLLISLFCAVAVAQAGSISGKITTDGLDDGIAGVYAQAFQAGIWVTNAPPTNASGQYVIDGLEDGSYQVRFWAFETDFITRWYSSSNSNGLDYDQASFVSVSGGEETGNVNITLLAGESISGQVVNETGCAAGTVEGLWVMAYDSNEEFRGYAVTNENGEFTITSLPPTNDVKLLIWDYDGSGVEEWYQDATDFANATSIPAGTTANIAVDFCSLKSASSTAHLIPVYMMLNLL